MMVEHVPYKPPNLGLNVLYVKLKLGPGSWRQYFVTKLPIFSVYFSIEHLNLSEHPVMQIGHFAQSGR